MTVVPEIDTPGHTNAALASYAKLNCDGKAPPLYTGTDVGFSSLCIAKPVTYELLDDVLGQLARITPGPYLHIGGDEAHSTTPADYATFIGKAGPIVAKYGKNLMGWNEIGAATIAARLGRAVLGHRQGLGGRHPDRRATPSPRAPRSSCPRPTTPTST